MEAYNVPFLKECIFIFWNTVLQKADFHVPVSIKCVCVLVTSFVPCLTNFSAFAHGKVGEVHVKELHLGLKKAIATEQTWDAAALISMLIEELMWASSEALTLSSYMDKTIGNFE